LYIKQENVFLERKPQKNCDLISDHVIRTTNDWTEWFSGWDDYWKIKKTQITRYLSYHSRCD